MVIVPIRVENMIWGDGNGTGLGVMSGAMIEICG
jgi:hypothetical protein